jgi:hypothetical protein
MEDSSNLHRELLFAPTALVPLLVSKPNGIAHLSAPNAENLTIGPAHRRDFINANLLIAKVLNCVYESSWVCHELTVPSHDWFVKYISTEKTLLL